MRQADDMGGVVLARPQSGRGGRWLRVIPIVRFDTCWPARNLSRLSLALPLVRRRRLSVAALSYHRVPIRRGTRPRPVIFRSLFYLDYLLVSVPFVRRRKRERRCALQRNSAQRWTYDFYLSPR